MAQTGNAHSGFQPANSGTGCTSKLESRVMRHDGVNDLRLELTL